MIFTVPEGVMRKDAALGPRSYLPLESASGELSVWDCQWNSATAEKAFQINQRNVPTRNLLVFLPLKKIAAEGRNERSFQTQRQSQYKKANKAEQNTQA